MSYAPVLTPDVDDTSVGVRFSTVDPKTQTMTVVAITEEGSYPVRQADRAYAVGGFQVVDHEAPLGVVVTYRGQMFSADGADLGYTDSASTQLDIDPSLVVFSDPLVPSNRVILEAKGDFGTKRVRRRPGNTFRVGSRTIGLFAPLGLLEAVGLAVQTWTADEAATLNAVLEAMPVLVRSMPPARIPRQLYVAIDQPEVEDIDVQYGGGWSIYPLQGAEVSRSVTDIVVPIVTWQTYMDVYPTWAEFNAAYATWLDAMENPPDPDAPPIVRGGMTETPAGSGRYTPGNLAPASSTAYSTNGLAPVSGRPTAYQVAT
ncbi:hypothetical protein [Frigoribacterium sp. PhB24]|uniref:hypothetical protein n=1 Tax=Frigoribacterium sp. PhB24 TaxID=2485204 RepID=UPI000F909FDC|nr:hypothetical protein [Frigoribacterium sp. PhB24]ROS52922.1 hypothetical protein EDF50_1398 [Frigoribacterium sp. PhB24]